MKRTINFLFGFLIVSIFLQSCEKDSLLEGTKSIVKSDENRQEKVDYIQLYNNILSLSNLNEQKIVLSTFSPETQSVLWQMKLNNYLKYNDLTSYQVTIINELRSYMTLDNFVKVRQEGHSDLKQDIETVYQNVINSFDDKNIGWYLLNKFENINQTLGKIESKPKNSNATQDVVKACECNSECYRLTGASIWGFSWEVGTCEGDCYQDRYIFGLINSSNTGLCKY